MQRENGICSWDYNVPCDKDGHITDDRRIRSTLPTIRYLLKEGAAVILASHMGRPKGERNPELSRPAAERLSELLDQPVQFADDCIGSETAAMKKFSRDRCCFLKIFVSIKKKKRMIPILQKRWWKAVQQL